MSSPLVIEFDVAEPRLLKERLIVSADGPYWDVRASTNVLLDPATSTLMLMPLPLTPAWQTTFTGNYARYAMASYTLTTSAAWVEAPGPHGDTADTYLIGLGTNEAVKTTATFSVNQAVYLSQFITGAEDDQTACIECGWGTKGSAGSVWIRIYRNGDVDIFKGTDTTVPVGSYDLHGGGGAGFLTRPSKGASSIAGRFHSFCLIPCRGRELLFITNFGEGFSHTFEDLDSQVDTNTITPASFFWWQALNGQPHVQFAPLRYASSGTGYGSKVKLRYAPASPRVFDPIPAHQVFTGATASYGVAKADTTAYSPDGVTRDVRAYVNLSSDGTKTPFIYAIDLLMAATTTTTADAPFDVMPYAKKLSLSVPENGPATVEITCKSPVALEAAGLEKALIIGDRPFRVAMNGIDLIRGRMEKPKTTLALYDPAAEIVFSGSDRDKDLEDYYFPDTLPYDGLQLKDVILDLSTSTGAALTDMDITPDTFRLPFLPSVSEGDWQLLPQRGDTPGGWLTKLRQDYAATWISGWCPTLTGYKRRFRRPDTLSTTPVMELFESHTDAAAFGIVSNLRSRRTIRALRLMPEAAEANQVIVIGYDKRTRQYIPSQYDDAASQAPGTAPGSRPDNWRGFTSRYQFIAPAEISSQQAADRARGIISDRITTGRDIIEIDCDFLIRATDNRPLWKGDVLRLYLGRVTEAFVPRGDYRILAIPHIECVYQPDPALSGSFVPYWSATYVLLKIGPGTG